MSTDDIRITEPCSGPGCYRPARASGLCDSHYRQLRTHGRLGRLQGYQRSTLPEHISTVLGRALADVAKKGA
jgi:hypothetical protein